MLDRKAGTNHVRSEWLRRLLICIGWLSIAAAVVGLFLPLAPSVPFLLLAVFCFSKSSERFHSWLVEHKHLGPMIRDYLLHGGIPLRGKVVAIGMIWISFPLSACFFVEMFWLRVLLLSIAAAVTVYLVLMPTASPTPQATQGTGPEDKIRKNARSS